MVDVSAKTPTRRVARASGALKMTPAALAAVAEGRLPKGDAFAVARVAGIQAAKQAAGLIPLCHPLPLDHVSIAIDADPELPGIRAGAEVVATARTGAEMEALTAVAVALLAVYDMAKSLDRSMTIESIRLEEKAGGTGGDYVRQEARVAEPGG